MPRITLLTTVAATLLFTVIPLAASAQTATAYSVKPVRLMVGASAGGGDLVLRAICSAWTKNHSQNQ